MSLIFHRHDWFYTARQHTAYGMGRKLGTQGGVELGRFDANVTPAKITWSQFDCQ